MNELKTMKDLQSNFAGSISTGELKEEAIKDYKRYYKQLDEASWGGPLYNALLGKLEYIKQKNNLKDEDLK